MLKPRSAFSLVSTFIALCLNLEAETPNYDSYLDIEYVQNGHELQKLDIHVPKEPGNYPLIIWIHGGGWFAGDKSRCVPLNQGFIDKGYAVASINYRLTKDSTYPSQIEDCKAAIRWLRAHATEYKLDPERFGAWGASAGGHLSALVGTLTETDEYDVGAFLEYSSHVKAVCDYYGPTDFRQMDDHAVPGTKHVHNDPNSPESRLIGGPIQAKENYAKVQRANPITYISENTPPFLIVHGDLDRIVAHHQSELLFDALTDQKIPVKFVTIKEGGHGRAFPKEELKPMVISFFDRFLKDQANDDVWPKSARLHLQAAE